MFCVGAILEVILRSNECTLGLDVILVLYKCDMRSLGYGTKNCEIPLAAVENVAIKDATQCV